MDKASPVEGTIVWDARRSLWNGAMLLGAIVHTQGEQDWTVDSAVVQAHNVPLMAIPTMGESWHNNHHAFPGSARHGLYPGQIDLGWEFVRLLRALGLAWNVQVPAELPPRPGISPVRAARFQSARPARRKFRESNFDDRC
jgi:fatty-acid desaturase